MLFCMLELKQMLGKLPWNIWKTVEKQLKKCLFIAHDDNKRQMIYGYP